jgi:hypothetical protein
MPLESINAHTYGSFAIPVTAGGGAILSGPANFPGHPPAGPGTCDNGLWINAQGKRTAGTIDKPHPHCFTSESATTVVLEPISSCFTPFTDETRVSCHVPLDPAGTKSTYLQTGYSPAQGVMLEVHGSTSFDPKSGLPLPGTTFGTGTVVGYAMEVATGRRVGILAFRLEQYDSKDRNHFEEACGIDDGLVAPCLNLVIVADYKPFAPEDGGLGTPGQASGFLWFTPATTPYNYR